MAAKDSQQDPKDALDAAAVDADEPTPTNPPKKKAPAVDRPYPRKTLEDSLRVPEAIRDKNGSKPWPPAEVANALDLGMSSSFFYLTSAAKHFGLTDGTRDASTIGLTELGKRVVLPPSAEAKQAALLEAFFSVDIFRKVVEHYNGSKLPEKEYVGNTLQTQFKLDPRVHDEFIGLFEKNCRFVGIGAEWNGQASVVQQVEKQVEKQDGGAAEPPAKPGDKPICFVIMPFVERTDEYATGFFTEVFASLFKPAIEAAGFVARTAKRQGSDVIQATIINELLDADLVLADLTEHNPNVLFELGVRLKAEKPTALVRATGTNPIFDVDNLLRVESYNPNMWPSTVKSDLVRLTEHVKQAWDGRDTDTTYMALLRRTTAQVA